MRVLSWSPGQSAVVLPRTLSRPCEATGVVSALAAVDELAAYSNLDDLLRRAIELARDRIGLERAGLYLLDSPAEGIMRGTWGTGPEGEITDERSLYYECGGIELDALREVQTGGARWTSYDNAPHIAYVAGRSVVIGQGWVGVTPLVANGRLIGILYNDTAVTGGPQDEAIQLRAAVYCSLLASLILLRRGDGSGASPAEPQAAEPSPLVKVVVRALDVDPLVTGQELARRLGVSPGHLARSFKAETGISLVEYRNRLRIERFFKLVEHAGRNLFDAASDAGFGSYAQFHRVFRRLLGTTPREYVTGHKHALPDVAPKLSPPSFRG